MAARNPVPDRSAVPPSPPAASPGVLTAGNIAVFALLLAAEAAVLTVMLRRVRAPEETVSGGSLSRSEYHDLPAVTVAVRPARPDIQVSLTLRVEASLLLEGDPADRARARDLVRNEDAKVRDEIGRVVGSLNADQALDPGNRARLKDRLRSALNQSVFRQEIVREVVFRYYGP
ncbi:MAG: flagellar basal body-associated FliL family protein [Candidatus Brocadiae bacterium]|nr:flagellar basal body-associated FliL family protein [Candidatus Brocadiia bacterium]